MNIEELPWKVLNQEISFDKIDNFTLYFVYSILIELRLRLIKAREKYGDELGESLSPIISNINKLIEEIHPKIKDMDICYAVLEASMRLTDTVSGKIFEKILLGLYRKIKEDKT